MSYAGTGSSAYAYRSDGFTSTVNESTKRSSTTGRIKQTVDQAPVKTFDIIRTSKTTWDTLELQRDGHTVLWSTLHTETLEAPVITLRAKMEDGPVVAGVRLVLGSWKLEVVIGDPATAHNDEFITIDQEGRLNSKYIVPGVGLGKGRDFQWRKTHQKELGSGMTAKNNFKLVDPRDNDNIIAAYINSTPSEEGDAHARVDFYTDCGYEFELETLVTIIAIEERIRRHASKSGDTNAGYAFFLSASSGWGLLAGQ